MLENQPVWSGWGPSAHEAPAREASPADDGPTEPLLLAAAYGGRRSAAWRLPIGRRHDAAGLGSRGRQRLAIVGLFAAAVIVLCTLAAAAYATPAPYARAGLASFAGTARGAVVATVASSDNTTRLKQTSDLAAASWGEGSAVAWSYAVGDSLASSATVAMTDVSLLDGRIRVARLEVDAACVASRSAATGDSAGSYIEDLTIDGARVEVGDLPVEIPGVGRLNGLERRLVEDEDGGVEVRVSALRIELSTAWHDLPEGSEIVVGFAGAAADVASATRLVPEPAPSPTPDESGGGSSDPDTPEPQDDSPGDSGGGSTGERPGDGSSSASDEVFDPGPMPAPTTTADLIDFPGAVFPVDGEYWYSDDFGAPRAVGGGHTGIDVFALKGTPLVAVQDGTIEELRYRSLGGNSLHLVNGNGDFYYYAHLDHYGLGIENGTQVLAGDVIGYVGNTGNAASTAPHCHFEVHPGGGDVVNPFPYLELWRGANEPVDLVPADSVDDLAATAADTPSMLDERAQRWHRGITPVHQRHSGPSQTTAAGLPATGAPLTVAGLTVTLLRRRRLRPAFIGPADVPAGLRKRR